MIQLLLGLGLVMSAGAVEPTRGPVPIELLFVDHEATQMQVSPDGKYLASIFVREKELVKGEIWSRWTALAAFRIDDRKPVPLLDNEDVLVLNFWWVGDNRLLVTYAKFLTGRGHYWGMFSCNPDGSDFVALVTPGDNTYFEQKFVLVGCEVLHTQTGNADEVVVARRAFGDAFEQRVQRDMDNIESAAGTYLLNVRTGKVKLLTPAVEFTHRWLLDATGHAAAAVAAPKAAYHRDGRLKDRTRLPDSLVYWINDDGSTEHLKEILTGEDEDFVAIGITGKREGLLFRSRQGKDKAAIYLYRRATKTIEGPLASSAETEAGELYNSPLDGSPVGAIFPEAKTRIHYFDPRLAAMQKGIDAALPEYVNRFVSWDRELDRVLIFSESPSEPGRYFLFDRKAGTLEMVFNRTPWLKGWALGNTEAVTIPAHDGLAMSALLTRPPGAATGNPLPMVLLVHGGPWGIRDQFEFDPERAFYATRGYAVLQVNFRGSAGYGRAVELGSFGQMGNAMQNDLNDAVAWAVKQGVADPARVIIAGNSYGGYAALRGATRDPNLFAAAIAGFAPVNLTAMFEYYRTTDDLLSLQFWTRRVGTLEADAQRLTEISPVNYLHRLKIPLFIQYGDNDQVVEYGQSKQLTQGLRTQKKKFTLFAPPNQREGHGFGRKENRFKAYTEIEKFLAKHLPAN